MYNVPTVTRRYIGSNNSDIRDSLRNGSYDFKHDPNYVIIGWNLWDQGSTKAELEKMLNEQISDTVYSKLKEYSSSGIIYRAGGSVSIVYGKGADGELRGKYAGIIRYNTVSDGTVYNFIGTDPANTQIYGESFSGTASY